jgi:hypothetical protein
VSVDVHTGEIIEPLTAGDARHLTDLAKDRLGQASDIVLEAIDLIEQVIDSGGWLALGYSTVPHYLLGEFDVSHHKLDAEGRRTLGLLLVRNGVSKRAAARQLGVDEGTVRGDVAGAEISAPADRVIGQDGKSYPGSPPVPGPKPDPVEAAVERYPDLDAWRDRPDQLLATATALDGYDEHEKPIRLDALAKHAAARREGRMPKPITIDPRPEQIFDHVNAAARLLDGYADVVVAAADPVIADTWRDQYERTGRALLDLAARLKHPSLRSVK